MATQPRLSVRPATPGDVPLVLAFIRGLAEYERLTHLVEATEESVRATLFGDAPSAEALLGFVDDTPAGFAVYFHTYSTFLARPGLYLEDIYVSPEHRRQGLGSLLMRRVAAIAVERGCGRFEWAALDWNTDAHRFYEGLGAEMLSEWRLFRMTGEALRRLGERSGD
ncbi:MAG: GNAT family N-acetyltransferase [Chloroflexi bacterium]|nr:GNAT family N-acetyltransferase [Chloroflexota bacterium]